MNALRCLLFCMLSLALLPGAQARASMPVHGAVAAVAGATDGASGGCHDPPDSKHTEHAIAHRPDAAPVAAAAATSAMECCPEHDGGVPGCGGACACPLPAASALMHAAIAGTVVVEGRAWRRPGHAARTGPPGGPPQRPPIG